jgi:hypothetical protein
MISFIALVLLLRCGLTTRDRYGQDQRPAAKSHTGTPEFQFLCRSQEERNNCIIIQIDN